MTYLKPIYDSVFLSDDPSKRMIRTMPCVISMEMSEYRVDLIDSRYAAVSVSFLSLLEKMSEAYEAMGDDIGHDLVQFVFEELASAKVWKTLSNETLSHFNLGDDLELFGYLMGKRDVMNPYMKTIIDDVIKIRTEGERQGQYYVDTNYYDDALYDLAAGRVGTPMERSQEGVYELVI